MRRVGIVVLVIALFAFSAIIAIAEPTGPTNIGVGASSRYDLDPSGYRVDAYAGNITQLDINATTITEGWQGYFGNVLGTIVLGNSNNETLYDWTLANPSGEVYASRASSITWTSIACSDATLISDEESTLNFSTTAKDGVDETFGAPNHPSFFVGAVNITSNSCNSTNLHDSSSASVSTKWYELLLADGTNMVYTALLENNQDGFNGNNYDFQLMVAEDGSKGDSATTPYYFWVELE